MIIAFSGLCIAVQAAKELVPPIIAMQNTPLSVAIRHLTRQLELNYILDPRLLSPGHATLISDPELNFKWRSVTVEEGLQRLLTENGLALITNSATSVARIVPARAAIGVTQSSARFDTNGVLSKWKAENLPLTEAIENIAKSIGLTVSFGPRVEDAEYHVSFDWSNITPRQALAALIENYDLVMIENPNTNAVSIQLRRPRAPK
jgi:hypothetical protein